MAICGHKDIPPSCPSKDEPMGEKIFAQFLELDVSLIAGGTKYEFAACLQGESTTTTHLADMTCCGPLAFSLHSWHFGFIRLVDSLKRSSAMAEHAKLGVRLNRMGCVDGRKIHTHPTTIQDIGRRLCAICVHPRWLWICFMDR